MKRMTMLIVPAVFLLTGCLVHVPPGQIKKETAPGQVQKNTGYNPASGKVKNK